MTKKENAAPSAKGNGACEKLTGNFTIDHSTLARVDAIANLIEPHEDESVFALIALADELSPNCDLEPNGDTESNLAGTTNDREGGDDNGIADSGGLEEQAGFPDYGHVDLSIDNVEIANVELAKLLAIKERTSPPDPLFDPEQVRLLDEPYHLPCGALLIGRVG